MYKVELRVNKINQESGRDEPGDVIGESPAEIEPEDNGWLKITLAEGLWLDAGVKYWLAFPFDGELHAISKTPTQDTFVNVLKVKKLPGTSV